MRIICLVYYERKIYDSRIIHQQIRPIGPVHSAYRTPYIYRLVQQGVGSSAVRDRNRLHNSAVYFKGDQASFVPAYDVHVYNKHGQA